jgi:acetyl esterase/lipase
VTRRSFLRLGAIATLRACEPALPRVGGEAPRARRIAYGRTSPVQVGELLLPAGPGPNPVAVVIHGGFWLASYGLSLMVPLCEALAERGVATWNVEYRRVGDDGGGWPGTFLDVGAAVDHVTTLAPAFGLDLGRVVTVGHSAGGHLALWAAARPRIAPDSEIAVAAPLPLHAAVSLAGVPDLVRGWEMGFEVIGRLLGGSPGEVPERYAAASPAALLPLGVRQVLVHGTDDGVVPIALSEAYRDTAVARGDDVRLVPLAGGSHFAPIDPTSPALETIVETLIG